MKSKLVMRYPASWHREMWREGAPCGNGKIGALVYGGAAREKILLNHSLLWKGDPCGELPDVSYCLPEIRRLIESRRIDEADSMMSDELKRRGYKGGIAYPLPLCDLNINTEVRSSISGYRRIIDMKKAEVTVSWTSGGVEYTRSVFVSRAEDTVFTVYKSSEKGKICADVSFDVHNNETAGAAGQYTCEKSSKGSYLYFSGRCDSVYEKSNGEYGAVGRVFTDGVMTDSDGRIKVSDAGYILIAVKLFIGGEKEECFNKLKGELSTDFDYNAELKKHTELHLPLFCGVDFSLSQTDEDTSNEELLLEAFDGNASDELIEKMYSYGRYLFICATSDSGTLPCHLTGLWSGSYPAMWAFYMYNINFQMIYWQSLSGNLPSFLRLALDYTEGFIEDFRINARRLYGCRGIYICSVNTPESGIAKELSNHIINWTAAAAWISQHFWDYYRFTCDEAYLREHALPFMYEAALFYEDFLREDKNGYLEFSPSVSPENTPLNIKRKYGREVETARNACMDIAAVKELLTNLLAGCQITGQYKEKTEIWEKMISKLPPYAINADGSVREWNDAFFEDNYEHRHQSHIYPVFPGCEIGKGSPLFEAFVKAAVLRLTKGLSEMSSWSMVNLAAVFARMEMGNTSLQILETIGATTVVNNFFTLHNDWRRMGPVMCGDIREAPFQIDANIGFSAAVNEMLLQSQNDDIFILPALPDKWKRGKISGILARGNISCNIEWDDKGGTVYMFSNVKDQKKKAVIGSKYVFEDGNRETEVRLERTKGYILRFIKA